MAAKGLVFAETVYNPLPVDRLYVTGTEFDALLAKREVIQFHPFAVPSLAQLRIKVADQVKHLPVPGLRPTLMFLMP